MKPYVYSPDVPASNRYEVRVDGVPVHVLDTRTASVALFECEGGNQVEVIQLQSEGEGAVHPLSKNIPCNSKGNILRFSLEKPQNLTVQFQGQPLLFLHISAPETEKPDPNDENTVFFAAGKIYDVGRLELSAGQTLYIEGGAVIRGCIRAYDQSPLVIRGRGILDGSFYDKKVNSHHSIILGNSDGFLIKDITILNPTSWMIVPVNCTGGHIQNVQEIGEQLGTDGVDVVGSRDILIEDCQFQNHDDCIAIKAFPRDEGSGGVVADGCKDVDNILVRNCIFENTQGVVFEIGHELETPSIRNIRFTDCDILHSHTGGSLFGIHNCDFATVSDITYENIRVEHYWDKCIDLRVMESEWARYGGQGHVDGVTIRNVDIAQMPCNIGYTISLIGGFDSEHLVKNIQIESLRIGSETIKTLDELNLFTRHAEGISIKG